MCFQSQRFELDEQDRKLNCFQVRVTLESDFKDVPEHGGVTFINSILSDATISRRTVHESDVEIMITQRYAAKTYLSLGE